MAVDVDTLVRICRERSPRGLHTFYNWALAGTGFSLPDHMYPVVCALMDTRINKLQLQCGPGSTKSQLLSIVYPTFALGHQPFKTILEVSGSEGLSQDFLHAVMSLIKDSQAFRMTFPEVAPDPSMGWSPASGAYVTGHPPGVSDASFWACGLSSKVLTGKHANIIILDDLHDDENSASAELCAKVVKRYASQIVGRAAPSTNGEPARFILAGRRWSVDDLYGQLEFNGDWVTMRLPAERPGSTELYFDVYVPETVDGHVLECVFTDGFCVTADGDMILEREHVPGFDYVVRKEAKPDDPKIRHYRWVYGADDTGTGFFWPGSTKRQEYYDIKRLQPQVAEAVYQCNPGAKQGSVFTDVDFERRFDVPDDDPHFQLGAQNPWIREMVAAGASVVQAWDTSFSANSKSDYTVGVTALLVPCAKWHRDESVAALGECEPHVDVYIVHVWRQRLEFAAVAGAIRSQQLHWQPRIVVIEKRAYGVVAIENLETIGVPLEAVAVSPLESKRARAVEGVGAGSAQGWFRMHRVLLPRERGSWDVDAYIREFKDFTGEKGGRDDQVDATVHLIRWAIQNGAAGAGFPEGWDSVEAVDRQMQSQGLLGGFGGYAEMMPVGGVNIQEALFSVFGQAHVDPFEFTCGRCGHYAANLRGRGDLNDSEKAMVAAVRNDFCLRHRRHMAAVAGCDDHEPIGVIKTLSRT